MRRQLNIADLQIGCYKRHHLIVDGRIVVLVIVLVDLVDRVGLDDEAWRPADVGRQGDVLRSDDEIPCGNRADEGERRDESIAADGAVRREEHVLSPSAGCRCPARITHLPRERNGLSWACGAWRGDLRHH